MIYVGNADTDVQGALAVGAIPVFVDRDRTRTTTARRRR